VLSTKAVNISPRKRRHCLPVLNIQTILRTSATRYKRGGRKAIIKSEEMISRCLKFAFFISLTFFHFELDLLVIAAYFAAFSCWLLGMGVGCWVVRSSCVRSCVVTNNKGNTK
jgi:hypothetical protein